MHMKKDYYRLVVKGGVLSPGELMSLVQALMEAGLKHLCFGSRQDILFSNKIAAENLKLSSHLECIDPFQKGTENIVCSYVSSDIVPTTPWLTSDRYLYILEQFKYLPKLKINIVDPLQRLVPLFSGHLNFIASKHEDYWYLYLRMPNWSKTQLYPALIYSWDIGNISKAIEQLIQEELESIESLFELVNDAVDSNNRTIDSPLNNPFHPFPYYEGMNKMGVDIYWLGLYWRNNKYDLEFLRTLCELCAESKIGKICITPWKSFIIKGIPASSKLKWEKLLGSHGINVRHSQLELNWHLPVGNKKALKLKNYLVSKLDRNDISTYGLTIGISDTTQTLFYFTSIVIECNPKIITDGYHQLRDSYNIVYAKDFDPNTRQYKSYAQEIDMMELPGLLMELSKKYFKGLRTEDSIIKKKPDNKTKASDRIKRQVHQCMDCLTIYDEQYGDLDQGIPAETAFEQLHDNYLCPLCEAPKWHYKPIILNSNTNMVNT